MGNSKMERIFFFLIVFFLHSASMLTIFLLYSLFFCILCLIFPHFGFTPLFISPIFLLLFLLLLLCLPLCPCLICLLFPVLLFFPLPLMFSLLTDLQRRQKQRETPLCLHLLPSSTSSSATSSSLFFRSLVSLK